MVRALKEAILTRPRLYDFLNNRRPIRDPVEQFLDSLGDRRSFVQIGASDGLRGDPLRQFVIGRHWSGTLVEPLPGVFRLLERNYASRPDLTLVNAAITDSSSFQMWSFSDAFLAPLSEHDKLFYLRKASLHKDQVLRAVDGDEQKITQVRVETMGVNELLTEHFHQAELDLLMIDAEGHDADIIMSIDFEVSRPGNILFEAHSIDSFPQLRRHLEDQGYSVSSLDGDAVAILQ
ncbi:MAG: FkbM family methyltransferase [Gemmatimonadetes bacterium]|nr:FkbM family methyltransferase [Gemmatimonadota bacterium]MBT8405384.1 FkbM family methyltransferase [Gemmatimonadota bacterium]